MRMQQLLERPGPMAHGMFLCRINFGEGLGLTQDWAYRIIKLVGNYGEVFDKNVGDGETVYG